MSQHTPGDWVASECKVRDRSLTIISENGTIVIHRLRRTGKSEQQFDADVRLIKSAPNLLAALKGLVKAYNNDSLSLALDAIAKAEK